MGIAAQYTQNHYIMLPLILCVTISAFISYADSSWSFKKIIPAIILCIGIYSCGGFLLQRQINQFQRFHTQINQRKIDITGTVSDIQYVNRQMVITIKNIATKQQNDSVNKWTSHQEKIQIYTNNKEDICVSDTIEVHDIYIKNAPNSSFSQYLIKEGIGTTLFIPKLQYTLKNTDRQSWQCLIHQKKESLYNSLRQKFSPHCFTMFSAIFLGKSNTDKKQHSTSIKAAFSIWGIMHYLARSGLHLVILVYLWLLLLNTIPISCNYKYLTLIIVNCIYCLLSWSSIPFYRALATVILYKINSLLRLQNNFLHLLAFICLCILLYNPIQLLFLDFQLSFGLTFALAYFSLIKTELLKKPLQTIASH
ncbi:MAG TPA: ComEC/Rec2 family competence protein [Candidatus Babeliales bacterium]|nr:ComEC/Rec2 family competence protein [Candidatus Babeliales bacterium]